MSLLTYLRCSCDLMLSDDVVNLHLKTYMKSEYRHLDYANPISARAFCMIVSLTAQNTTLMFSVSVAVKGRLQGKGHIFSKW